MEDKQRISWEPVLAAFALLLPMLHPMLIPVVGAPSHLAWFAHALVVAIITYRYGFRAAPWILVLSALLVFWGERTFGGGNGNPADWATAIALGVSTFAVNLLMVGFAAYARAMTRRHTLLFSELTVGVLRLDRHHIVRAVNPEAIRILAGTMDGLVGRPVTELLPQGWPDLNDIGKMGWNGTVLVGSGEHAEERQVIIYVLTLEHPHAVQVLIVDRTMEAAQEQEIARQSKLASLGEALAGVAHEFKNPLQVISGYAQLADQAEQDADTLRDRFGKVKEQADRMDSMVQDLLGYSRRSSEEQEMVELGDVVRDVVAMQRIALGKRVRLVEQIDWEGAVCSSANKVQQILLNFISNSADAIADGTGSTITVRTGTADGSVECEVFDDGPGIPEEFFEQVFQPFATTKEKGKGTGLGLAISMRFARSMEGELVAANRPEGGASFTLRLPLEGTACPREEENDQPIS